MNREKSVDNLKQVFAILNDDVDRALDSIARDPNGFNKRNLIRTYFALIEGLAYQLRQVTLASLQGTNLLSDSDLAILHEHRHQLSRNGLAEERENFQATLPMLLFSLRVYAKNHGAEFLPATSDYGWECLCSAIKIRDRITHPKSLEDLEVTDQDGSAFAKGIAWWNNSVRALLDECQAADQRIEAMGKTGWLA